MDYGVINNMKKNMNINEVKNAGYEALNKSLGSDGMIRFLKEIDSGHDDYTKKRQKNIDKYSVDEIYKDITKNRTK